MVNRRDKPRRFACWKVRLAATPRIQLWKTILRSVIQEGRRDIEVHEISKNEFELVWPKPVAIMSSLRLCALAREKAPDFKLFGDPLAIGAEQHSQTTMLGPTARAFQKPKRSRFRLHAKTKHDDVEEPEKTDVPPCAPATWPRTSSSLLSLKCES